MSRHKTLIRSISMAFIFSLGLMAYQNINKTEIEISEAWKAPIQQSYEFYLNSLLKHLQLNAEISYYQDVADVTNLNQEGLPI